MEKKYWRKRHKAVSPKSEISTKIWIIQNLINKIFFFENIFSGIQLFYIRPHVPVDIIGVFLNFHTFQWTSSEFFFNFRFFSRKSQSQQKQSKKITLCTIQKTSLILWTSTYYVSVWCQKKHLHSTTFWRPKLHSWSSLKANVRIFLYISVSKVLFQSLSQILSDGEWVGGETE